MTTTLNAAGYRTHVRKQPGSRSARLREWGRLLNPNWRNLRYTHGVAETLADHRFVHWLRTNAHATALAAAADFDHQTPTGKQMLTMLVRCFRLGHRVPRWARRFDFANAH